MNDEADAMDAPRALQYPWARRTPEPGAAIALTERMRWMRLPLPFALDHVNVWLLRDRFQGRDGWTVVDCGVDRPEARAAWERAFDEVLEGLPIVRVLVTHMHPDHVGLAHWLCARFDAPLWMTLGDYAMGLLWSGATTVRAADGQGTDVALASSAAALYAHHGLVDEVLRERVLTRRAHYRQLVPDVPRRFQRLLGGQTLSIDGHAWHIIVGYGHAPEHASFWCPTQNVLISGDMVLPRISTNVSVYGFVPEDNPLAHYLESLDAYDALPPDALVLPSHGRPFRGLATRVAQQRDHHAARLDEVREACAHSPRSAWDLLPVLFHRPLDAYQLSFAMGEAIAHLHVLYFRGELERTLDADGIYRFRTVTPAAAPTTPTI